MTRDPGGIWRGSQRPPPPWKVLGETPDGGAGGGVLHITLIRGERLDSGTHTISHHIQCGGGFSGPPLGIICGGKTWR